MTMRIDCQVHSLVSYPPIMARRVEKRVLPVSITSFKSVVDCDEDVPGLLAAISDDDNGDNSLSDEIDVDGDA
jgi:hypothetical protein